MDDYIEKNVFPILKVGGRARGARGGRGRSARARGAPAPAPAPAPPPTPPQDVNDCWQPADFLPDPASPDFLDEVRALQARTAHLPDEYWVVLVGDMITEEALPTYMAMLNTLDGVRDETGASGTPWARWNRAWTAEENRHGDLMNKYCYLSGRVDMRSVEKTIQNLIGSGMDPKTENNPYHGFIYTSFQVGGARGGGAAAGEAGGRGRAPRRPRAPPRPPRNGPPRSRTATRPPTRPSTATRCCPRSARRSPATRRGTSARTKRSSTNSSASTRRARCSRSTT